MNANRNIQSLRHQIEDMKNSKARQGDSKYLYDEKNKLQLKLIQAKQEFVAVEADYTVKKESYTRNKDYHKSLVQQYEALYTRKTILEKSNRDGHSAAS